MIYRQTSRDAWNSMAEVSGDLDRQILEALRVFPFITCENIEEYIGRSHQSVSGNLRHLVERGYVEDSGQRGVTKSGRPAVLWVLTRPNAPPRWSFRPVTPPRAFRR